LELETAREKHKHESQAWKEQNDTYERQLIEKSQLVTELKAELTELTDREASATSGLKVAGGSTKDETRKLKTRNDELENEQKHAQERQNAYEGRLAKATVELVEAESALAESEHKREGTLHELKAETDVLRAQLGSEQKTGTDRERDFDKELKLHKDRFAKELIRSKASFDKDIKQRDQKLKSQEESFKYKIKHLEAAERELQGESKSWKDLPSRKELERLTNEIRQLKGLPPVPAAQVEDDDDIKVETKSYEPAPSTAPKETTPAPAPAPVPAASTHEAAPAPAPEPAPVAAATAVEEAEF